MKIMTLALTPVLALAFGTIAFAQADLDTDGDGMMSFAELVVAYPDLTEETFTAIDADADGSVSEAEMSAAIEAGVIPAME